MNTDVNCSIIEASSNELLYQIEVHNGLIPAYIVKKHDGPIPYIHTPFRRAASKPKTTHPTRIGIQCLTERKSPVSKAVGRSHIDPILFQLDCKNPKRHHVSNRNCNRSQIPLFQYIDLSNKSGPLETFRIAKPMYR